MRPAGGEGLWQYGPEVVVRPAGAAENQKTTDWQRANKHTTIQQDTKTTGTTRLQQNSSQPGGPKGPADI